MDKTPGQIVCHVMHMENIEHTPPWDGASEEFQNLCDIIAAAVIAHVTPAIETKARTAAVADCVQVALTVAMRPISGASDTPMSAHDRGYFYARGGIDMSQDIATAIGELVELLDNALASIDSVMPK
jgi:hypothetical protein